VDEWLEKKMRPAYFETKHHDMRAQSFETSAKTGENVSAAFEALMTLMDDAELRKRQQDISNSSLLRRRQGRGAFNKRNCVLF
jgi:hypothetical protein